MLGGQTNDFIETNRPLEFTLSFSSTHFHPPVFTHLFLTHLFPPRSWVNVKYLHREQNYDAFSSTVGENGIFTQIVGQNVNSTSQRGCTLTGFFWWREWVAVRVALRAALRSVTRTTECLSCAFLSSSSWSKSRCVAACVAAWVALYFAVHVVVCTAVCYAILEPVLYVEVQVCCSLRYSACCSSCCSLGCSVFCIVCCNVCCSVLRLLKPVLYDFESRCVAVRTAVRVLQCECNICCCAFCTVLQRLVEPD